MKTDLDLSEELLCFLQRRDHPDADRTQRQPERIAHKVILVLLDSRGARRRCCSSGSTLLAFTGRLCFHRR